MKFTFNFELPRFSSFSFRSFSIVVMPYDGSSFFSKLYVISVLNTWATVASRVIEVAAVPSRQWLRTLKGWSVVLACLHSVPYSCHCMLWAPSRYFDTSWMLLSPSMLLFSPLFAVGYLNPFYALFSYFPCPSALSSFLFLHSCALFFRPSL